MGTIKNIVEITQKDTDAAIKELIETAQAEAAAASKLGRIENAQQAKTRWERLRAAAKDRIENLSIRSSFVYNTLVATVIAILAYILTVTVITMVRADISEKYSAKTVYFEVTEGGRVEMSADGSVFTIYDKDGQSVEVFETGGEKYSVSFEYREGEPVEEDMNDFLGVIGEGVSTVALVPEYSSLDAAVDIALRVFNFACAPIYFLTALFISSMVFFRTKLKVPLEILDEASEKIAENQLDFTISYPRRDELGRLCVSFEKMRSALLQNSQELWRQMEERRRVNAAFSHDLRTPLTVLRGRTSMLLSDIPEGRATDEEIVEQLEAMSASITRLENYIDAMRSIQRMEDMEINREEISIDSLARALSDSAEILSGEKGSVFINESGMDKAELDQEIVLQVYENIFANAVRFAKSEVKTRMFTEENMLCISVEDDGPGFTAEALSKATSPFYKGSGNVNDGHLGLGLNICHILCTRHGGKVTVENGEKGGKVTVSFNTEENSL